MGKKFRKQNRRKQQSVKPVKEYRSRGFKVGYDLWLQERSKIIIDVAKDNDWELDQQYTSPQGSTYLWFTRNGKLVKIRFSDHRIDYRKQPTKRKRVIPAWSKSLVYKDGWQRQYEDTLAKLKQSQEVVESIIPPKPKVSRQKQIQPQQSKPPERQIPIRYKNKQPLCKQCSEPISIVRLQLIPRTKLCFNCQKKLGRT